MGIVCEISVKNSIDKKAAGQSAAQNRIKEVKKNSHRLHSTIQKKALQDVNCKARESVFHQRQN